MQTSLDVYETLKALGIDFPGMLPQVEGRIRLIYDIGATRRSSYEPFIQRSVGCQSLVAVAANFSGLKIEARTRGIRIKGLENSSATEAWLMGIFPLPIVQFTAVVVDDGDTTDQIPTTTPQIVLGSHFQAGDWAPGAVPTDATLSYTMDVQAGDQSPFPNGGAGIDVPRGFGFVLTSTAINQAFNWSAWWEEIGP